MALTALQKKPVVLIARRELQIIAQDAVRTPAQNAKPKLTIMVVGETVRADHFGLNGYKRNTTPLASQKGQNKAIW